MTPNTSINTSTQAPIPRRMFYPSEPKIIVYQATNLINGKRYIGVTTKGLRHRAMGHNSQAGDKTNKSYFTKAVRKYGIDAFDFSIIEECSSGKDALIRERELIAELKPEYNTAAGGCSGPQGWKHSEDSIRLMSESHIGKIGPWRGKKRSSESIAKRTATRLLNPVRPWLGKKRAPETIAKMLATKRSKPVPVQRPSPEVLAKRLENMRIANENRMSAVYCLTDGKAFKCPQDAADYYGVSRSAMGRWLAGEAKCQRGLEFEFVE